HSGANRWCRSAAPASPGAAPASTPPAPTAAAPASNCRRVIVARSLSMSAPPTIESIGRPAGVAGLEISCAASGTLIGCFPLGPPHLGLLLPEHDRLQQVEALLQ